MASSGPKKRPQARISYSEELPNVKALEIEDEHTNKPTTDRNKLTRAIEDFSKKAVQVLKIDHNMKKRYATKLILSNRIKVVKKTQPTGEVKNKVERETFPVSLPTTADTWNDLDETDIQIQLLRAVVDIHELYVWHRLKLQFIYFINQTTRDLMIADELKERGAISNPSGATSNSSRAAPDRQATVTQTRSPASALTTPSSSKSIPKATKSSTSRRPENRPDNHAPRPSKLRKNLSPDSDEDIEIVYETTK